MLKLLSLIAATQPPAECITHDEMVDTVTKSGYSMYIAGIVKNNIGAIEVWVNENGGWVMFAINKDMMACPVTFGDQYFTAPPNV